MRKAVLSFAAGLAWAYNLWAQAPTATVRSIDVAPVIDGQLDEPCWQGQPEIPALVRVGTNAAPGYQTRVWLARNDAWLFLAFECADPQAGEIKPGAIDRDGPVFKEESVEVFISPGTDGQTYYHFSLSAGNVQGDNRGDVARGQRHISWDAHWRSATQIDAHQGIWTAELAIPLFYLTGKAGTNAWRFNVCRSKWHDGKEASSWAPLSASYHDSEKFGNLRGLEDIKAAPVFAPVIAGAKVGNMRDLPESAYEVVTTVLNDGGAPGAVEVTAADVTGAGVRWISPQRAELAPGHQHDMAQWIVFEAYEPRSSLSRVTLRDALGAWEFTRAISWERSQEPFTALMDRSYYTGETECYLVYHSPLPAGVLAGCRIRVTGALLNAQVVETNVAAVGRISLPLKFPSNGAWQVEARLEKPDGQAVKTVTCAAVKRDSNSSGNTVKIDHWRRCVLLNEKPFAPYGFYGAPPENFGLMASCGANAATVWMPVNATNLVTALDLAQSNGLYLMTSPISDITLANRKGALADRIQAMRTGIRDVLPDVINQLARHPGLLAYHLWDEPERVETLRDALKSFHDTLRELDGYHPAFTGDYIILEQDPIWTSLIDLGFPHHYWVPTGVEDRVDQRYLAKLREIRNASRDLMMPVWQGTPGEFHSRTRRMMTPAERRVNVYLSLIHEVTGIFYFAWPIVHESTHATMRELRAEIDALAPALFTRTPEQTIEVQGGDSDMVLALLKEHPGGGGILLAANTLKAPLDVTFTIAGLPDGTRVTRMFGAGAWVVKDRGWTETLESFGVRAYRLSAMPAASSGVLAIRAVIGNAGVALARPADQESRANLLANPGFETDGDWDGMDAAKGIMADAAQTHTGKQSLRLKRPDAQAPPIHADSKPVVLKPNTCYRIGAWFYGEIASAPEKRGGPVLHVVNKSRKENALNLQCDAAAIQGKWVELAGSLETGPAEETIWIQLAAMPGKYKGDAWIDDVFVEDCGGAKQTQRSRNLMPNSGFEYATAAAYPDRWWGLPQARHLAADTLTPRPGALVRQDGDEKMEGKFSLRLRGYTALASVPTRYNQCGVRLVSNTNYVFSIYMKADRENYEVRFSSVEGQRHTVKVSKTWQRYHWPVRTPNMPVRVYVHLIPLGSMRYDGPPEQMPVLWVDAAQFEEGTAPTEYTPDIYSLSDPGWMSLE